jgi:D-lactate dehydrogenase
MLAAGIGKSYGATTIALRTGLGLAAPLHGMLPGRAHMLPKPARLPSSPPAGGSGDAIVYFPSCAARTFGSACGDASDPLPVVAERLFRRAGFTALRPARLAGLCCGQPFESKGYPEVADEKAGELEGALREAADGGRLPIVFDTSPCAWRMRRFLDGRLDVRDGIEFLHDAVLPRLSIEPRPGSVAVHAVCSVRKMGIEEKLFAIAARCSERVIVPPEVQCCGFAGDKGFTHPELNAHALRHLRSSLPSDCREGYSSSRTCEMGLSERAGIAYRSIMHLVDACACAQ